MKITRVPTEDGEPDLHRLDFSPGQWGRSVILTEQALADTRNVIEAYLHGLYLERLKEVTE